jgi:hypothetical protein
MEDKILITRCTFNADEKRVSCRQCCRLITEWNGKNPTRFAEKPEFQKKYLEHRKVCPVQDRTSKK